LWDGLPCFGVVDVERLRRVGGRGAGGEQQFVDVLEVCLFIGWAVVADEAEGVDPVVSG
jgi:hypothetical protein